MAKGTQVAVQKEQTAIAVYEGFEGDAGSGFEEITSSDLSIPFLRILAQLSPQVNKRDGAYIQGAEPGMILNTLTNEAYNGDEGILVIPCYTNRRLVEWTPREKGGGYVATHLPTDPIAKTTRQDERNNDILPNGNLLTNTYQIFVILLHPELGPQRCLITMTSTQTKKAKKWIGQMQAFQGRRKDGSVYTMPMASNVYRLRTVEERNDKGSWFGWEFKRERVFDLKNQEDKDLYTLASGFTVSLKSGEITVKADMTETHTEDEDEAPF